MSVQSIVTSPEKKKKILDDAIALHNEWTQARESPSFDNTSFRRNMADKYADLYKNTQAIYNIALSPSFDASRLKYLLEQAYQVYTQKLTEHDASVKVGKRLVDDIVKPQLKTKP